MQIFLKTIITLVQTRERRGLSNCIQLMMISEAITVRSLSTDHLGSSTESELKSVRDFRVSFHQRRWPPSLTVQPWSICRCFPGLSLDHQTVSAVSRVRLSEREEESMSCFLRACDAALSYLQELDKVSLSVNRSRPVVPSTDVELQKLDSEWCQNLVRMTELGVNYARDNAVLFSAGDDAARQNSQILPASRGHRARLLPAGCVTECLPLSAAEGVMLQNHTTHTQAHKHPHTGLPLPFRFDLLKKMLTCKYNTRKSNILKTLIGDILVYNSRKYLYLFSLNEKHSFISMFMK